jgi:hypothetical protein
MLSRRAGMTFLFVTEDISNPDIFRGFCLPRHSVNKA